MLARPTNLSENQAAHYYEQDDYYTLKEASNFAAYWHGKGAMALGLQGAIVPKLIKTEFVLMRQQRSFWQQSG